MNNLVNTMIFQMARRTHTELTEEHYEILEFAYEYYCKNRVGPLYHILYQKLGFAQDHIDSLFPYGLFSIYSWLGINIQNPNQPCKPLANIDVENYREVYFDHNGTTYLRDHVKKVLEQFYNDDGNYGNPSSSTTLGKIAYEHIFQARRTIAETLKVSPGEIRFTSGGTEANNLALKGIAFNHLKKKGHIISSSIEHASVLNTLKWLESIGYEVTLLGVTPDGMIPLKELKSAFRKNTILVSIMAVNNEIGVINPIQKIAKICKEQGVPFMSDCAQAYGKIPLRPKTDGISIMTFSGHKIYAPKGTGGIFIDDSIQLTPIIHGGEQELGIRSGTENLASIVCLGKAAKLMHSDMHRETARLTKLRDYFLIKMEQNVTSFRVNGSMTNRLPNNLNIGLKGVDSGAMLLSLNRIGIYVSSGSACSAGSSESSHVIKAIGGNKEYGTLRFSFGLKTSVEDIDYLFEYLPTLVKQLRSDIH